MIWQCIVGGIVGALIGAFIGKALVECYFSRALRKKHEIMNRQLKEAEERKKNKPAEVVRYCRAKNADYERDIAEYFFFENGFIFVYEDAENYMTAENIYRNTIFEEWHTSQSRLPLTPLSSADFDKMKRK